MRDTEARRQRRSKMKFGVYLEQNMAPGWEEYYLRYKPLKIQLKEIVALNEELATKSADANTLSLIHI